MHDRLLKLVQQQFALEIHPVRSPLVVAPPLEIPPRVKEYWEYLIQNVTPTSNESTRRWIVGQLLLHLAGTLQLRLFIGGPFEVDPTCGLVGQCDYLVSRSPLNFRIHPPVSLIVEVKREIKHGLPHCLVEMAAAQLFNASPEPIYGVSTTGLQWQFLKLEGKVVSLEQKVYPIEELDTITSILAAMMGTPLPFD
ncbi:hypothetical protein H6G89_32625 [Oscillatoria sp. FACHB-1407]|uniref:hypothetical protein n=1 Tax=Oscillatoria sp. FACHB-1407 TaxID=2692847 RepID=UPI001687A1A2|nr:hypothetical protein [Oscillatoria sp. FACHB-1407]MBD2465735.1 hypothetical protein [Oscillatoria sp. FACHB-1407]